MAAFSNAVVPSFKRERKVSSVVSNAFSAFPLAGGKHQLSPTPLLIVFKEASPQHVLLVLGHLEDCSCGRWKLHGNMNQWHHISYLSLIYMDISMTLFQEVPPGSCPRCNGKKGAHSGTLQSGKQDELWGHRLSVQADLQPQKDPGGVKLQAECRSKRYSRPARRLARLPGAALLAPLRCDPSAMQSTREPSHPANKIRLLKVSPWDPVLPGILLPRSAYWNGRTSAPRLNPASQIDICRGASKSTQ